MREADQSVSVVQLIVAVTVSVLGICFVMPFPEPSSHTFSHLPFQLGEDSRAVSVVEVVDPSSYTILSSKVDF